MAALNVPMVNTVMVPKTHSWVFKSQLAE